MTNEVLDQIREGNRTRRMRMGQNVPDYVQLPSNPEVRFAMVPLTEAEIEEAWASAADLVTGDNAYGVEYRDRIHRAHVLFHALRMPGDTGQRVFESVDDLKRELDETDIGILGDHYSALTAYASPMVDTMTPEVFDELKKAFETIDLSVLSGKQWWHLIQFFMNMTADQLPDRSRLESSMQSLIGMKEEAESTPGA